TAVAFSRIGSSPWFSLVGFSMPLSLSRRPRLPKLGGDDVFGNTPGLVLDEAHVSTYLAHIEAHRRAILIPRLRFSAGLRSWSHLDEPVTLNQRVLGSSPSASTIFSSTYVRSA